MFLNKKYPKIIPKTNKLFLREKFLIFKEENSSEDSAIEMVGKALSPKIGQKQKVEEVYAETNTIGDWSKDRIAKAAKVTKSLKDITGNIYTKIKKSLTDSTGGILVDLAHLGGDILKFPVAAFDKSEGKTVTERITNVSKRIGKRAKDIVWSKRVETVKDLGSATTSAGLGIPAWAAGKATSLTVHPLLRLTGSGIVTGATAVAETADTPISLTYSLHDKLQKVLSSNQTATNDNQETDQAKAA